MDGAALQPTETICDLNNHVLTLRSRNSMRRAITTPGEGRLLTSEIRPPFTYLKIRQYITD